MSAVLEQIFDMIGADAGTAKCAAMAGFADEGEDMIDEIGEGTAQRGVGLIFAGQKAEHSEIASYGVRVKRLAMTMRQNY